MTAFLTDNIAIFIIAFARVAGCVLLLPGFASPRVPAQARALIVLTLTMAILPALAVDTNITTGNYMALFSAITAETIKGSIIGLIVRFYLLALSFMMNAASASIGLNAPYFPSLVENEAEQPIGAFVSLAAVVMIFTMDFHHMAVRALADSYVFLPINEPLPVERLLTNLTRSLSDSFIIAFRLGGPFLFYALVANVFAALLNKLAPVIPVYFVITPVIAVGGLGLAYLLLPNLLGLFGDGLRELLVFN